MERWSQTAPWHPDGRARPRILELHGLTSLRFLAALLVFLRHERALTPLWPAWSFPFDVGFVGVSFFFILSGFVLAWAASAGNAAGFYRRRFARIYPLHVVTWVLALAFIVVADWEFSWLAAGLTLLLLQAWVPQESVYFGMNGVSWSLSCEAAFYVFFPRMFTRIGPWSSRRRWTAAFAVLAVTQLTSVALSLFGPPSADPVAFVNPALRAGEFILGAVMGLEMARGWRPRITGRATLLLSAVAVAIAFQMWKIEEPNVRLATFDALFVVPFACLIATVAYRELEGRRSLLQSRMGVYLGRLSYAFYLSHALVALTSLMVWGVPSTLRGGLARLSFDLGLALGAAALLHHAIELPVRKALLVRRARGAGRQPQPQPQPVGAGAPA